MQNVKFLILDGRKGKRSTSPPDRTKILQFGLTSSLKRELAEQIRSFRAKQCQPLQKP